VIIPCIDLQGGLAVQLVRGRKRKLAIHDVYALLDRFRGYPLLHIIDLDAAMRRGSNGRLVRGLCRRAKKQGMMVRVGGGIRSVARAERIVAWGADQVIIGSVAFRRGRLNCAFLSRLAARIGRRRTVLALDAEAGNIVVRGWREKLRLRPEDVLGQCAGYASGVLCTYVDNEGTMRGTNLDWYRELRRHTRLPITAAGGIRSHAEVRALERMGMDAAVGMAMYAGKLR
jgi:phosphoribosylformimino-5-aminoimidazole carboxamide ribotide isomerase